METSPTYCRHLRFLRFQKLKLSQQNKSGGVYGWFFLHILTVVLVLSELLQWVTGKCMETVSRASFGGWGH